MDMAADQSRPRLRLLMELRPALAGHAGIPQATRLLFRSLATLDEVSVEGLLQTTEKVLSAGLPESTHRFNRLSTDQEVNRLSRVVIAMEQDVWGMHLHSTARTIVMALKHLIGGKQRLTRFDARHFRDFVWRRLFSRTLSHEDFEIVTRAAFRIATVPWFAMHICALVTRPLGRALYSRLDTAEFDVMIAETPYPARVSRTTQLVIHYHDAIPLLMPHTISDRRLHQAFHYRALRLNVENGAWFVCVSDATRADLLSVFPQAESRAITIHNMVSHEYFPGQSNALHIAEIVRTRWNTHIKPELRPAMDPVGPGGTPSGDQPEYLLIVSTIEPRKNHIGLLAAWERLRVEQYPTLKLIIVGALGWHHTDIVLRLRPWVERGEVFLLEDVLASELRVLYQHARATVCPSFGEGFDYSGVEAMRCGGVVAASDIPVHREIYGNAAEYFNPYSVDEIAHAIEQIIKPANSPLRGELIAKGARISARYTEDAILPVWRSFLAAQSLAKV